MSFIINQIYYILLEASLKEGLDVRIFECVKKYRTFTIFAKFSQTMSRNMENVDRISFRHFSKWNLPMSLFSRKTYLISLANIKQTLGKHPKVNTVNTEHSESLKSRV
jgi:hypothetical protein